MDILNAYQLLAREHALPKLAADGYQSECEPLATPEAVWTRLTALAPGQGWLLFQSAQMAFPDGLPERDAAWGVLLAAEAYIERDGVTVSLALEQDGRGGWTLTTYTHEGAGPYLRDDLEQLAYDQGRQGPGKLRYRRYWRADEHQGYVQAAACFIGFN